MIWLKPKFSVIAAVISISTVSIPRMLLSSCTFQDFLKIYKLVIMQTFSTYSTNSGIVNKIFSRTRCSDTVVACHTSIISPSHVGAPIREGFKRLASNTEGFKYLEVKSIDNRGKNNVKRNSIHYSFKVRDFENCCPVLMLYCERTNTTGAHCLNVQIRRN